MKRKNGFTLIELLAVVIIIAIISLIVTPIITGTIKTSKDDLYETQIENIKSAAKTFMVDLDLEKDTTLNLTLEDLKKSGFLKKDIKNPKTGEYFANCTTVNVTRSNDTYNYEVIVSEDNNCSYDSEITMILLGYSNVQILKGNKYNDAGILLRTDKGKLLPLDKVEIEITKDLNSNVEKINGSYNNLSSLIDTTDYYKYEIIYKYTYNGETISKIRTVEIIEDTNLECMILPTTSINENGWITGERKAKILSINTDKNVQYSLSEINEKNYNSNQIYEVPNDGVVTLYGYIKDEYGNEASCSNILKYEVANPSCSINLTGTKGTDDWFGSNVTATLSITPISSIKGKDITTDSEKSYNNNSVITLSGINTVYGYIKDEAGKEVMCQEVVKIDKVKPTVKDLTGLSASQSGNTTTKITLTATASDRGSGIYDYKFYKISDSTETYLGNVVTTSESTTYDVTSPAKNDSYKVIVTDKAGNTSEKKLEAKCSTYYGTCSNGYKWVTVSCTTGYTYKYSSTDGCTTTTTTNTNDPGSSSGGGGVSCKTVSSSSNSTSPWCTTSCDTSCKDLSEAKDRSECRSSCYSSCPTVTVNCQTKVCDDGSSYSLGCTNGGTIVDDATSDAGASADDETLP